MRIADLPPAKSSAARERLLETARRIFYAEGINTVGVQRIIEEAGVTLATFYRHFPSKQDLILAYLQSVHDDFEDRATAAQEAAKKPADVLTSIGNNITAQLTEPGFRGCAFINAAISTLAVAAIAATAFGVDAGAALAVFGAWAAVSGAIQLALALRRHRAQGHQFPLIVSGGLSTIVGIAFIAASGKDHVHLTMVAGYMALGALLFLLSAVRTPTAAPTER